MSLRVPLPMAKSLHKLLQAMVRGSIGSSDFVHEPAADTAAVVTLAAPGAGLSNVLGTIAWSYDGDPAAGSLTVQDGTDTVWKMDVTKGGPGPFSFLPPLRCTENGAMVITLSAGGGSVSGLLSVHAWID